MTVNIRKIIKSFKTTQGLDEEVAIELIREFKKPGLILLPVGATFEKGIYPKIKDYFSYEEYQVRNTENQDPVYAGTHHQVHPGLFLSHLDELVDKNKTTFSDCLKKSLKSVIDQIPENLYAIDIDAIDDFDRFIKQGGGPRVIVLGLGSDPEIGHVAFIGEEFLNTTTTEVKLSEAVAEAHGCTTAVTIGTDVFQFHNLERIIVVVKGEAKAEVLASSFKDPDTGLGYLIKNHADKLEIFADEAALGAL